MGDVPQPLVHPGFSLDVVGQERAAGADHVGFEHLAGVHVRWAASLDERAGGIGAVDHVRGPRNPALAGIDPGEQGAAVADGTDW